MRKALALLGFVSLLWPAIVTAGPYLNSVETMCNGSNANVLLCDDFETAADDGGHWYAASHIGGQFSCDYWGNQAGGLLAHNKGWCGKSISVTPAGAHRCGGQGVAGSACAATTGQLSGSNNSNLLGDHTLLNEQSVPSWRYRLYVKFLPTYQWGHAKFISHNQPGLNTAGIQFGNLMFPSGGGASSIEMTFQVQNQVMDAQLGQNVGAPLVFSGTNSHWYFIEVRMVLETGGSASTNGILQIWLDDCGTSGVCTGTPTLRMSRTNMHFRCDQSGCGGAQIPTGTMLGNFYFDFWSNPPSNGEFLVDNLVVTKDAFGQIGFVGATAPTAFGLPGGAGADTFNTTGAVATLTPLPGPTLIGFVHRSALVVFIVAVLALFLWRRMHVDR